MERENKIPRLNKGPLENENDKKVDDGGENGTNENELSDMDKLPSEILMKILCYLREQELVKCRIVSSRWNEICCLLLQDKIKNNPRSKLVVRLSCYRNRKDFIVKSECETVIKKPLSDFLECFFPSVAEKSSRRRPFPFSTFRVSGLCFLQRDLLTKLALTFPHIKSISFYLNKQDFEALGTFWRLLLKFAPNIEYVGLSANSLGGIDLFEPYFNFNVESDPADESQNQNKTFLKNLKVVEISSEYLHELNYFYEGLLSNTPNLEKLMFDVSHGFHTLPGYTPSLPLGVYEAMHDLRDRTGVTYNITWTQEKCIIDFKK